MRELHLHALARQGATPHASADDRLVSIGRVLDHGAPACHLSVTDRPRRGVSVKFQIKPDRLAVMSTQDDRGDLNDSRAAGDPS